MSLSLNIRCNSCHCTTLGVAEDKLKEIEKHIRAAVTEAADFAEKSPEPEPSELYTDVLVENY